MVKDIAVGAANHGFDSQAGQIHHSVAYGLPLALRFLRAVFFYFFLLFQAT